jgi:MFS transporter, DHA1 family, multidrug resistance protein
MAGLFGYISAAPFVLQGVYGLNQQAFAVVFAAGAVALISATQFNVVLLRRFSPQVIMRWALVAATISAAAFVILTLEHIGGLAGFLTPIFAILAAIGLVIPNAPAVALTRHPDAAGTAAALLGAAQFGIGAAVAPLVGALGNDAVALSAIMLTTVSIALVALLAVGDSAPDLVAEPA